MNRFVTATGFVQGSTLHITCLAVSCAFIFFTVLLSRHSRRKPHSRMRYFVAIGCLILWIFNTAFFLMPIRFQWDQVLPLHVCNLANLIGAVAVWKKIRLFQAVLYFWTFALCIWAFLTPALLHGPAYGEFWIFWAYHIFILIATSFVLTADNFRAGWQDWRKAVIFTLSYMIIVAIIDRITGWNYGFVGAGKPDQPTLLDVLGPYPLRLLWIALIGFAVFTLLMLPFCFSKKAR